MYALIIHFNSCKLCMLSKNKNKLFMTITTYKYIYNTETQNVVDLVSSKMNFTEATNLYKAKSILIVLKYLVMKCMTYTALRIMT